MIAQTCADTRVAVFSGSINEAGPCAARAIAPIATNPAAAAAIAVATLLVSNPAARRMRKNFAWDLIARNLLRRVNKRKHLCRWLVGYW